MGDLWIEREEGAELIGVNHELTEAVFENIQHELELKKKIDDNDGDIIAAIFSENEADRFFGTEINSETIRKAEEANVLLDIISIMDDVKVQKFTDISPYCRYATVAIDFYGFAAHFTKTVFKAFRRLTEIADDFDVMQFDDHARIAFGFDNLWSKHREMTDAELEDQREKYGLNDEGENDND